MLPAKATSAKGEELQWLSWKGDTDMQAAVVGDTCYTFTGRVTLPAHDGEAGLLLRYNEKVFSGITADATTLHVWHRPMTTSQRNWRLILLSRKPMKHTTAPSTPINVSVSLVTLRGMRLAIATNIFFSVAFRIDV